LCIACSSDIGFPNVRAAASLAETEALSERFQEARGAAGIRGAGNEFDALTRTVGTASHVVVAMTPLFARAMLTNRGQVFQNYETLVDAGVRAPAEFANDAHRRAVSGTLFGSYAHEIRYGVLSLDGRSLSNYGTVYAQLRDITVQDRVSFLAENSYSLLPKLGLGVGDAVPPGYRSDWEGRSSLVATKLEPRLAAGQSEEQWSAQLVVSGEGRSDDEFVEAHIYGDINAGTIEAIAFAGIGSTRGERLDILFIREQMADRNAGRATR
jgi:hypothetical protein